MPYTIFWTNFFYSDSREFATLKEAAQYAKSKCQDATILQNDEAIAYWNVIGGFKMINWEH